MKSVPNFGRETATTSLNQFGPEIENAGYFQFPRSTEFHYTLKLHHLILIEKGQLDAMTDEGPVCGRDHDFLCFRPTAGMSYRVQSGTVFYEATVQFFAAPRNNLTPEFPESGPLPVLTSTASSFAEFRALFDIICVELPQKGSPHLLRAQAAVFRILALLAQHAVEAAKFIRSPVPLDALEHVYIRVASINGGDCSPVHLAREIGVSRGYFLKMFKLRFGMAPGLVRMRARLGEAVRQLRETKKSVKSVAYDLGFDGAKGLTRALRKHFYRSASEFRNESPEEAPTQITMAPNGLFPSNQNLLPPGGRMDEFLARLQVRRREF